MPKPTATYDAPPVGPGQRAKAYVAVFEGEQSWVVELRAGWTATIGRSRSCGIRLDGASVSRKHASLWWDGSDVVRLTDHGSHNGTFLNGERVDGSVSLENGAEIGVAEARLVLALKRRPASGAHPVALVASDLEMVRVLALSDRAAQAVSPVLITGETGSGKELIARRIHTESPRKNGPFVPVNCGAIPRDLAEANLFGHEKGAFTGATARRAGFFEAASGGTLLLDEVGELDLTIQAKLLRVLETGDVRPVGRADVIDVDVRVVAATHRDLAAEVKAGRFRQDLLYRLDVLRIEVPPLRERPNDLPLLAQRFVEQAAPGRSMEISEEAMGRLRGYTWPGNVRELRNVLERAVALSDSDVIRPADLTDLGVTKSPEVASTLTRRMEDVERDTILAALEASDGNQSQAARRLGISRRKLIYKLEKYGLKPRPI